MPTTLHVHSSLFSSVRMLFLGLVAAIALTFAATPAARAATEAESFVQQNINTGLAILNDNSLNNGQRRDKFRAFILGLTDMKRIAMFTLGRYRRGAADKDLDGFVSAFTDYANAVYEQQLSKYKGQTMKVVGSTPRSPDDIIVNVQVPDTKGGQPINAAFRVKTDTGKPLVVDVEVEGVWLAITQQDQFSAFLQQHGSNVPALSTYLVKQTETIRAGKASTTPGNQ
jgi:phospholipid transport system substrate-binding protein